MGEIYQEARRMMVKRGKMPPSAYDFALRDMAFSTGEKFILNKNQPGFASSSVVFFPGCQLSGSSPQYVRKIYDNLCEKIDGGVGLSLGCCGAPADWAGREEHFSETLRDIENRWLELGQPKIITACPTCYSIFKERLPQIELDYIWNVFEQYGLPPIDEEKIEPKRLVIHDACTTRHEDSLHESIRNILHKLGHEIQELGNSRQTTGCCGYGGLMMFANRELAQQVVDRRINESQADYLVYCAMCRDNFVAQGKRTYHLLDLIFGRDKPDRANQLGPDFSQRHENRARCKATFLKEIWGENVVEDKTDIKLFIPEEVRKILDDRRILIEDITKVIQYAEETGNRLKDTKTGRYIAYFKPVAVTYWVEYSPQEEGFLVHNAYSHRLEIN
jgi:Fe-S oxidoreductase